MIILVCRLAAGARATYTGATDWRELQESESRQVFLGQLTIPLTQLQRADEVIQ
jgi:hypothetical protein